MSRTRSTSGTVGAIVALLLLTVSLTVVAQDATEARAVLLDVQAIASDPEATSETVAEWADSSGGYYVFRSADRVELRVPPAALVDLQPLLENAGDEIVLYAPSAIDYRSELRDVEAGIVSRSESLNRVLSFLGSANVSATLAFERELRSLTQEIEYFEGRRRSIINDTRYARVTVRLSVRSRTVPGEIPSSFGWINSMSLYRFIDRLNREGQR